MRILFDSSRRRVLTHAACGLFATLSPPRLAYGQARPDPPLAPALVEEFVRAAHADLPRTKALLAGEPALLNATWDWGGGDFETGLGGAGHMGNREIAEFLIGQGARMDLFVAAMLGTLDIVEAMVAAYPALLQSKGPHGIPLMTHAKRGGVPAEPVVAFLEARGLRS